MAVPPVLEGLGSHPSRSQPERTRREDRRLKFYELRDNLVVLDAAVLDRIDEIVPPGTTLNPADNSFNNPALEPTARRR
jgi:hypothetical protein